MSENTNPNPTANNELDELKKELEELKNLALAQSKQIKALETKTTPKKAKTQELTTPKTTFTVDGVKYRFTVPAFVMPGEGKVLATDALKNKVVLEHLVSIQSQIVTKA